MLLCLYIKTTSAKEPYIVILWSQRCTGLYHGLYTCTAITIITVHFAHLMYCTQYHQNNGDRT